MASWFPSKDNQVRFKPRKGHDMTWSCDKHGEPMSFRCKKHKTVICDRCAIKEHCQKPCELEDIEDVIFEIKGKLDETLLQIEDGQKNLKRVDCKLVSCKNLVSNHIKSVNDESNMAFERRMQNAKVREVDEIRVINEEADEEIRIINERRNKRKQECKIKSEMQQKTITKEKEKVISETKSIDVMVTKKLEELDRDNRHKIDTLDTIVTKIDRIKQTDEMLVNEGPQVISSLEESYNANSLQDVTDYLDRVKSEAQRVRFVEGEFGGQHYARIDGYEGKWELVKSVDIPAIVSYPLVTGVIRHDEICVLDVYKYDMYVTNTNTSLTEKVLDGMRGMRITSCAQVDRNTIVCGKRIDDFPRNRLDRCITIFDRQWNVVKNISIPKNGRRLSSFVFVDVDRDGMILAAEDDQSNIYVINPADGTIVHTVTMRGKKVYWSCIQALSSGDILVQTKVNEFSIISRSGEEKMVIHDARWHGCVHCRVDKLTDTLYIHYLDEERDLFTVDQVSSDGQILAKRIIEYKKSDGIHFIASPCFPTYTGDLVASNGDKILIYKEKN